MGNVLQQVVLSSAAGAQGEGGLTPHGGVDALLQQSVGAAILEKLDGRNDPPSQIYVSKGGDEPTALTILKQLDAAWPTISESIAEAFDHIHSAGKGSFADLYARLSGSELALVERSVGQAILEATAGQPTDPLTLYREFGGQNPTTTAVFQQFVEPFKTFNPTIATESFAPLFSPR